jgi:hypothetical protein
MGPGKGAIPKVGIPEPPARAHPPMSSGAHEGAFLPGLVSGGHRTRKSAPKHSSFRDSNGERVGVS